MALVAIVASMVIVVIVASVAKRGEATTEYGTVGWCLNPNSPPRRHPSDRSYGRPYLGPAAVAWRRVWSPEVTVDGGRWAVGGGRWAVGGGRCAVDGGWWMVGGGWREVDRGQWALDGAKVPIL